MPHRYAISFHLFVSSIFQCKDVLFLWSKLFLGIFVLFEMELFSQLLIFGCSCLDRQLVFMLIFLSSHFTYTFSSEWFMMKEKIDSLAFFLFFLTVRLATLLVLLSRSHEHRLPCLVPVKKNVSVLHVVKCRLRACRVSANSVDINSFYNGIHHEFSVNDRSPMHLCVPYILSIL